MIARFAEKYLATWLTKTTRKPMVLRGARHSLKSLHQFMHQNGVSLAVRFDLNQSSFQEVKHALATGEKITEVKFQLISLPLYAVEQLSRIIDKQRLKNA